MVEKSENIERRTNVLLVSVFPWDLLTITPAFKHIFRSQCSEANKYLSCQSVWVTCQLDNASTCLLEQYFYWKLKKKHSHSHELT